MPVPIREQRGRARGALFSRVPFYFIMCVMCNFQELKSKKTSSSSGFTSGGEGENSMRKSSMSVYEFHWSWMENLAFAFSMAVLLSSYTASVLYIFRHCFFVH